MTKIKYPKNIFLGDKARERYKRIRARLFMRKYSSEIYFITLPIFGNNMLEIYSSVQFHQKQFKKIPVYVAGLAIGKDEALSVAADIVNTTYKETNKFAVKEYLNFGM